MAAEGRNDGKRQLQNLDTDPTDLNGDNARIRQLQTLWELQPQPHMRRRRLRTSAGSYGRGFSRLLQLQLSGFLRFHAFAAICGSMPSRY
jgi:hypothetical protein